VRGYQDREFWATAADPRHGRLPARDLDYYLRERIWSDTGGFCGEVNAVKQSLVEVPASQIVFATDYPQEIRDPERVKCFVDELKKLGADGAAILESNAPSLVPFD
jgi:predicted TIM-barrel fold metal-dependent hydrolase